MTTIFVFLLSMAAAQSFEVPRVLVRPEVAAERVRACGFKHVAVKRDGTDQEEVIAVSGVSEATSDMLRCVAKVSLATIYYAEFPARLNEQYQQLYWRMEHEKDRRDARAWLERRGLLAKLPTYVKGQTNELKFARKLEGLCGPKAKGAFVRDHGIMTMNLGSIEHPSLDNDTFVCLMHVSSAAGFEWGFIGNAYAPAKPK